MALFDVPKNPLSPFADMRGDHSGMRVPDLAAAVEWYTKTLDFRLTATIEAVGLEWVFLSPPNDDSITIELAAGPGATDRPGGDDLEGSLKIHGWHHFCWRVVNIEATLAELRQRGVKIVVGPLEHGPIKRRGALFADPWGNLFEIIQDA
jgi:catechol 2,3-dioxygenase-like lactoylglutathione lyase family enzyme